MRRRVLAVFALLLFLSGCQSIWPDNRVTETTPVSGESTTLKSEETIGTTNPSETTLDLGGYEFILAVQDIKSFLPSTGESVAGDRLLGIYEELSQSLNAEITVISYPGMEAQLTAASSGVRIADVAEITSFDVASLASSHAIYASEDLELVSAGFNPYDESRWYGRVSPQVQFLGRQWTVQIATEYAFPDFGTVILAGQVLLDAVGSGNLWNLIETGRWTQGAYSDIALASAELGVSGMPYTTGLTDSLAAVISCGGKLLTSDNSGLISSADDRLVKNGISYFRTLSGTSVGYTSKESQNGAFQSFIDGKLTFLWISSSELFKNPELLSVSGGFAVLPVPAPSAYEKFSSLVCSYKGFAFLRNGAGVSQAVTVFNALSSRLSDSDWLERYSELLGIDRRSVEIIKRFIEPSAVFSLVKTDTRFETEYISIVVSNISYDSVGTPSLASLLNGAFTRLIESGAGE